MTVLTLAELNKIQGLLRYLNDAFQRLIDVEAVVTDSNGETLGFVSWDVGSEQYVFTPTSEAVVTR